MKKYLIPIFAFVVLSCDDNIAAPTLEGQWQLFEVLADPGDGSDTFRSVESDQQLRLFSDGTFTSTQSLCQQEHLGFNWAAGPGTGRYDFASKVIIPEECDLGNEEFKAFLEIDENGHLIIYFPPCTEGCANKYKKVGANSASD